MKKIFAFLFIWMVLLNGFALISWNRLSVKSDTAYSWMDPNTLRAPSWNLLQLPARWDSEWYLNIAKHGYVFKGSDVLSNLVFFPVYPGLLALFGRLFLSQFIFAGWLISFAALCAACFFLFRLVQEFHPKLNPEEVVFFLLIFPTAIFLNAIYTESLFLFLSIASIYFARKKRFVLASIIGCAAALTRVTGVLLFIPLLIEFITTYKKRWFRPSIFALLLVPLGLVSFFAFHGIVYGDFLLFFKIENAWGRSFHLNASHFQTATAPAAANLALDFGFLLTSVILSVLTLVRVRFSYGVYMLATIVVAVSTGTLMSIGRYVLVLFPIYLVLASFPPLWKRSWTIASLLLLGLYTLLFAQGYWAG
ncbi:MAG TPA: mannosyltransferase family protein [Patescibacteria group bacterium]|nr:mannosyltransferase family protein [Patescibacteria group bacterium]